MKYYVNLVDRKTTDIISARICYPVKHKEINEICYPNILIFDEPKQQNLANDSLVDCITVMENISSNDNQVILTTFSDLPSDREMFCKHMIYEMKNKTDYLLKKLLKWEDSLRVRLGSTDW